jgi:hypothetical protein
LSDLLSLFGWPALILLARGLIDRFSETPFKNVIVEYFRGVRLPKDISISLSLFLHGFLYQLLGDRSNKVRFFLRSSLISVVVVILVFMFQQYEIRFRNDCSLLCRIRDVRDSYVNLTTVVVLLFVNCLVDYCANTVTISLIELASKGCSRLQFLIISGASLSLTVVLFTTIFPFGIVLSALMYQATGPNVTINAALLTDEYFPNIIAEPLKREMLHTGFDVNFISLTPGNNYSRSPDNANVLILATKAPLSQRKRLEFAAQLMTGGREDNSFVVGGDKAGWSAFVTVEDRPSIPRLGWLWAAYEAVFTATNLVREDFLGALRLQEIDQKLGDYNRDLTARYQ